MSNSALASAKKKRAQFSEPPKVVASSQFAGRPGVPVPGSNAPANPNMQAPGLTLPQVIQLVDKRLVNLEQYVAQQQTRSLDSQEASMPEGIPSNLEEILQDYDNRFQLLAEEIAGLKNMLLSLQAYTMDVNKTLMEERIRIFSDIDASQTQTMTSELQQSSV